MQEEIWYVVSDEIRKLAEQSATATREIRNNQEYQNQTALSKAISRIFLNY